MTSQQQRILVVYYSLDGHTRQVAQRIASAVRADILELRTQRRYPKGFLRYLVGGLEAMVNIKPTLLPLDRHPDRYSLVLLGTPVWGGRPAPALSTWLAGAPLSGQRVGLFCTCAGGPGHTFEHLRQRLQGNEIVGELALVWPAKDQDHTQLLGQARDWAQGMVGQANARENRVAGAAAHGVTETAPDST